MPITAHHPPHLPLPRCGSARCTNVIVLLLAVVFTSILTSLAAGAAPDSQATATFPSITPTPAPPTPVSNSSRLTKPIISKNPTQVEKGALYYWGICMACHGDRGQGLTDEWREVYGEDSNCWQSRCHGTHHPPQGFEIPRTLVLPAIAGPNTLNRYTTAQDLFNYIVIKMPWWKPNSLKPADAWNLTAYILKMNGALPEGVILSKADASVIPVHRLVTPHNDRPAQIAIAAILVLATTCLVIQNIAKSRASHPPSKKPKSDIPTLSRRPNFFAHMHPPTIPARQARWRYTLGAGGMAVFLSLVLLVTGILEMFYYVPIPEQAALSIQAITYLVPYGGLVRNMHYWAAQLLILIATVHLLRVVFTGAFIPPRRFNYLLGLGLLVLVLLLDFTGYILRWDEGIRWALVVGTNLIKTIPGVGEALYRFIMGGDQASPTTLIRFYTWHVFGLCLAFGILGIWHLFRIRRDGGIAIPPPTLRQDNERISRFELVRREVLAMVLGGAILLLLATFVPAPIAAPIKEMTNLLPDARAPWFFLWVQQLLKIGNPFTWGILIPLDIILLLVLIPYIFPKPREAELGRWFPRGGRLSQIVLAVLVLLILMLTLLSMVPSS